MNRCKKAEVDYEGKANQLTHLQIRDEVTHAHKHSQDDVGGKLVECLPMVRFLILHRLTPLKENDHANRDEGLYRYLAPEKVLPEY